MIAIAMSFTHLKTGSEEDEWNPEGPGDPDMGRESSVVDIGWSRKTGKPERHLGDVSTRD